MKKYFLFFILFSCYAKLIAQQTTVVNPDGPVMKFDSTEFHFGKVNPGEIIIHEFSFTNTGKEPLLITSIHTGDQNCVAEYPRESVKPGQKGTVRFTFRTAGLKGQLNKRANVQSNNRDGLLVLHLVGEIIANPPDAPVMTFDSTTIHFGTVVQGADIERDFHFTNTGKSPLLISRTQVSNAGIVFADYPHETILPGKSGVIRMRVVTIGNAGLNSRTITVESNNRDGNVGLRMTGKIIIDSANAPIMTFVSNYFDFGTVVQGTVIYKNFPFTNTGKSPLIISTTFGSGKTIADYPKEPILPGKTGIIKVTFSTEGRMGMQYPTSTIICNGIEGTMILRLSGRVIPDSATVPIILFKCDTFNFGTVGEGTIVQHDYKFTNTGKTPLIIKSVYGSAHNNLITYPTTPVAPGDSAVIHGVFDTSNKRGGQHQSFTITSNNLTERVYLQMNGNVIPLDPNTPIISFDSTTYFFGTVREDGIIEYDLHFKNTGKAPLVIRAAETACGCDVAEAPYEPIPPGGTGIIKYTFNAAGRGPGMTDKTVAVYSNNRDGTVIIHLTGKVIAK